MCKLFLFVMLIFGCNAFALSFEDLLKKARENSIDLKIAETDILASSAAYMERTSVFYPKIYAKLTTSHYHDFENKGTNSQIINGVLYRNGHKVETYVSIGMQYDIFKFFTDYSSYKIAKLNNVIQQNNYSAAEKNLALTIVDIYEKILVSYHEMLNYGQLADLATQLHSTQKRLYEAGLTNRQMQYIAAADLVDYMTQKLNAEKQLRDALKELEFYTDDKYGSDVIPNDFELSVFSTVPNPFNYPEYRTVITQIEQKELEMSVHKRSLLPTISVFAESTFYGIDRSNINKSYHDMEYRDNKFGMVVTLDIFDGFSFYHKYSRISAERDKLEFERQKILKKIKMTNDQLVSSGQYLETSRQQTDLAAEYTKEILSMGEALRNANLSSSADLLTQKIDAFKKLREQKIINIKFAANAKRLELTNRFVN